MGRPVSDPHRARALAHDDTRNRVIVLWGTVAVAVLFLMLLWLRSYFFTVRNEVVSENVLDVDNPKLIELRTRENAELESYGWVDRERQVVQIPIERAMQLVVEESAMRGRGGE